MPFQIIDLVLGVKYSSFSQIISESSCNLDWEITQAAPCKNVHSDLFCWQWRPRHINSKRMNLKSNEHFHKTENSRSAKPSGQDQLVSGN